MRVHAIIHAAFEGLGAIQTWLDRKDFSLSVSHPYRGDQLPNPNTYDWLIIMGGPQDLKQIHKYPYLRDELSLIQQSIDLNKMVLGICLGAQLIAESLGAKTEPSPEKEIGIFPVNLTDSGHADPITRHFPINSLSPIGIVICQACLTERLYWPPVAVVLVKLFVLNRKCMVYSVILN